MTVRADVGIEIITVNRICDAVVVIVSDVVTSLDARLCIRAWIRAATSIRFPRRQRLARTTSAHNLHHYRNPPKPSHAVHSSGAS